MKADSEHIHQVTFVNWFRNKYPNILIFAIPNGEYRAISTAVKLKNEGVTKGIPDLFIPEFKIWIEMKKEKGGTISKEQKEMKIYLENVGYKVFIARGYKEAIKFIELSIN
jgi:hypothetical protein